MTASSVNRLLEAITRLVAETHPDKIGQLADRMRNIAGPDTANAVASWAVTANSKALLKSLFDCWKDAPVASGELAGMLIGASAAYGAAKGDEAIELVWTGPSSSLVSVRHTEQALLEVIQSAMKELFLVSFVAYEVKSVVDAMKNAIERGVIVSILVESSKEHGGTTDVDFVMKMKAALPTANIYVWSGANKQESGGGYRLVHAKCSVADGVLAFITSANLTAPALERNMEAGVLIKKGYLPRQLLDHLKALATTEVIVRV